MSDFRKYLTWDGFLFKYKCDQQEFRQINELNENNIYKYEYGKTLLLLVILNKFILFLFLFSLVLFFVKNIYIQRSVLNIFILFLLFDIFIDETTFCIPLCDIFNQIYNNESICWSSAKINISLKIDFTGNVDDEDKKEEKEENEDKDEEDFDDEYDIKTI